jgi:HPt (histidine-containing phosphotransfer) domain-containing protein
MSDAKIIDEAILGDLIEHIGAEAVQSIIEIFLGECRELIATIGAATTPQVAGRAAHSLKSSAGQLGAIALAEAALAVETAAESGSPALPALAAALLACAAQTETALAGRLQ